MSYIVIFILVMHLNRVLLYAISVGIFSKSLKSDNISDLVPFIF